MNPARFTLAALAFGAVSILAPAAASANPWIEAQSSGQSVPTDGTTGSVGQQVLISGSGCTNPTPGGAAYMGEYVSLDADPLTAPNTKVYETQTDEGGGFTWDVTIPTDTTLGRYVARWYCATSPVDSIDDPAMLWVSPPMWMDVGDVPAAAPAMAARTVSAQIKTTASTRKPVAAKSRASADTGTRTVTMSTDPDALPAIDKVGITGPKAAALKAKVDAEFAKDAKGLNLLRRLVGGNARAAAMIDAEIQKQYVRSAADVLGIKALPAKQVQAYADRLEANEIRVNVVEDLALTVRSAAWYNAR